MKDLVLTVSVDSSRPLPDLHISQPHRAAPILGYFLPEQANARSSYAGGAHRGCTSAHAGCD